jgi:hypothetical protein
VLCGAEEDRKDRRRKLGLPEELTEEEKVRPDPGQPLYFLILSVALTLADPVAHPLQAKEASRTAAAAKADAERKKPFHHVPPVTGGLFVPRGICTLAAEMAGCRAVRVRVRGWGALMLLHIHHSLHHSLFPCLTSCFCIMRRGTGPRFSLPP